MKTIPVKDVAEALGISTRGVLYRREKGQLKGVLVKNDRGVDEYRIYPTKEIIEGLRRINSPLVSSAGAMEGFDVVDAQTVSDDEPAFDSTYGSEDAVSTGGDKRPAWTESNRAAVSGVAEELWNNVISRFVEKLEEKDQLIGKMQVEIKEKERQLLLLPDLEAEAKKVKEEAEKRARAEYVRAEVESRRAEEERQRSELKALEVESLKKQVSLLQEKINASSAPELERQLENEKANKLSEILALQEQLDKTEAAKADEIKALHERLADVEKYKRLSEESQRQLEELKKALEERTAAELEKVSETAGIREELSALSAKLEEVQNQKPWWKRALGFK